MKLDIGLAAVAMVLLLLATCSRILFPHWTFPESPLVMFVKLGALFLMAQVILSMFKKKPPK